MADEAWRVVFPAWREGDPIGPRLFAEVGPVSLELGGELPNVTVAYQTFGQLNEQRDNAVLVLHALTGHSDVAGPDGWWTGVVGPGKALDTDEWFVVCSNVLGGCQGTTGPSSIAPDGTPWGSRWPYVTVRDQVEVEVALMDFLGIVQWACVIGGSMGGMRALEWAVGHPERQRGVVAIAVGAQGPADVIAMYATQLEAITGDSHWHGGDYYDKPEGPWRGMSLARKMGQIAYRTAEEFEQRFGRQGQGDEDPLRGGRYALESYLDHHGHKLLSRFDAGTYVTLTRAMNTHDVGRGRGGVEQALDRISAPVWIAGIDSDRLYPIGLQHQLHGLIPTARSLTVVKSTFGHDGFLVESEAIGGVVRAALEGIRLSG